MWQWCQKEKCEEKMNTLNCRKRKKFTKKTPQNHLNISANGKKPNFYLYFLSHPHFLSAVFSSCPSFVRILTFNHIFLLVEWKKNARTHAIRHLNNKIEGRIKVQNKKKRKWFKSFFVCCWAFCCCHCCCYFILIFFPLSRIRAKGKKTGGTYENNNKKSLHNWILFMVYLSW